MSEGACCPPRGWCREIVADGCVKLHRHAVQFFMSYVTFWGFFWGGRGGGHDVGSSLTAKRARTFGTMPP